MLPETNGAGYNAAQIMMTLAAISYADAAQIETELKNTSYATNGEWDLVWGPVPVTNDPDNLMYVVKLKNYNIHAVVIRGTYLTFSIGGLMDVFEDLEVMFPLDWFYPYVKGAKVAGGTLVGLYVLTNMQYKGQTLLQYFQSIQPTIIYATGHSLGGCLTTVLAPWLQYQLNASQSPASVVIPYTFAAPTAGNEAFADFYSKTLDPNASRYYNDIDIVPMAWSDLQGIEALYAGGPACPQGMKDAVNLFIKWTSGIGYTQTNGSGNVLKGICGHNPDWFTEVGNQHAHNTYLKLLGAPTVNISAGIIVKRLKSSELLGKIEPEVVA